MPVSLPWSRTEQLDGSPTSLEHSLRVHQIGQP